MLFVEDALIKLHQARWAARAQNGVLADPNLQAFHREAAKDLMEQDTLRLYALRRGEAVVGVLYGFRHHARVLFYLSGFAPECSRLSPGVLMIGFAIEQAVREKDRMFDFLRGTESYKYFWGAQNTQTWRRQAWRESTTMF